MSYALYELALHPEIQNRLRAEIMQVLNRHNGQLTYDGIQEMAYLDMVVSGEGTETDRTMSCGLLTGAIFREYCSFYCMEKYHINYHQIDKILSISNHGNSEYIPALGHVLESKNS